CWGAMSTGPLVCAANAWETLPRSRTRRGGARGRPRRRHRRRTDVAGAPRRDARWAHAVRASCRAPCRRRRIGAGPCHRRGARRRSRACSGGSPCPRPRRELPRHLDVPLAPRFEHGVVPVDRPVKVEEAIVEPGSLALGPAGFDSLRMEERAGSARFLLLGGEPFGTEIKMWWNFVARTFEEITEAWRARKERDDD